MGISNGDAKKSEGQTIFGHPPHTTMPPLVCKTVSKKGATGKPFCTSDAWVGLLKRRLWCFDAVGGEAVRANLLAVAVFGLWASSILRYRHVSACWYCRSPVADTMGRSARNPGAEGITLHKLHASKVCPRHPSPPRLKHETSIKPSSINSPVQLTMHEATRPQRVAYPSHPSTIPPPPTLKHKLPPPPRFQTQSLS